MYLLLNESNGIMIGAEYPIDVYPEGYSVVEVDEVPEQDMEILSNEWSYADGEFFKHEPYDMTLVPGCAPLDPVEVLTAIFQASPETLEALPDESLARMAPYMQEWTPEGHYTAGDMRSYMDLPYRCLQSHDSQDAWNPEDAPSLWARILIPDPSVIPEWVQPGSTNPYMKGDRVRHNGKTWESLVDNNVWEPGQPGTESLWTEVA